MVVVWNEIYFLLQNNLRQEWEMVFSPNQKEVAVVVEVARVLWYSDLYGDPMSAPENLDLPGKRAWVGPQSV